ncbi:MAG: ArsA family ATPase [bacterium]|nr:ArsA family ATPase [bacterium]MCP5070449.1 ArsA family ATPase [bacterium]
MNESPASLLEDHPIVACVGSGGVGKTTLSAALALGAARRGANALVLTIDPAKRLADAMGQGALGAEPRALEKDTLGELGITTGSLSAMMLDTKRTFDDLVRRFARDGVTRDRIFANPIYQHVSDALAGSSEYSAMEKVDELVASGSFDVIVLDTPPSQHAMDFLEAPERLVGLVDSRIARHLVHPAMSAGRMGLRLLQRGTEPIFRLIERISGMGFLEDLAEFLLLFEELSEGFRARADHVRELLFGGTTAFVLAAGAGRGQVEQAIGLAERLDDLGARTRGVILNRLHLCSEPLDDWLDATDAWDALGPALIHQGLEPGLGPAATETARHCVESYALRVRRDAVRTEPLVQWAEGSGAFVRRVPELPRDVHDLATLCHIESVVFDPTLT